MAAPIGTWISSGAWTSTPINGKFLVRPGGEVKVYDPSLGQTRTIGLWGTNSTNFDPYLEEFKKSDYWGLIIDSTGNKYTIVRLWEHKIGGDFVGMPKRSNNDIRSQYAQYAARYTGAKADPKIAANFGLISYPVFSKYARVSFGGYYAILSTSERAPFETGKSKVGADTPSVGGGRGNNPGWDGNTTPPAIGPGSDTGTTIGTQPFPDLSGLIPDLSGFTPPSPTTTGPPKPGGQWVTGPDGKDYYLPPGIDFAGLQREYDRTHPKPETKIVVRMPKGYAARVSTYGTKPRIRQRYKKDPSTIVDPAFNKDGKGRNLIGEEIFEFPYIPQNIRYSDIGSQWQEIPRALNRSFVDWTGYKLMKVSMDFLVTEKIQVGPTTTPNVVSDGLFASVGGQLDILRRMATNKYPVTLEGFDDMVSVQSAYSRDPRGLEFVIQDLNITAGRRTVDINTGLATNPSNIAAAQVSLTLQEIPIETVTIVKLPPLNLGTPLIGKNGGGGGGGVPSLGLQSSVLTGLKWAVP